MSLDVQDLKVTMTKEVDARAESGPEDMARTSFSMQVG